jgi:hypothetical protein
MSPIPAPEGLAATYLFADTRRRGRGVGFCKAVVVGPIPTAGCFLRGPDHLHMLWRMLDGDTDYSTRIAVMKKRFTRDILGSGLHEHAVTAGQARHRPLALSGS